MISVNLLAPVLALVVSAPPPPAEQPLTALPYTAGLEPSFMNRTVDPCVDFYAYACGGWQQLNPIPPDHGYWDVYSRLREDITRYLWGISLEAAEPHPGRSAVETRVGDYFAACMDEDVIEAQGARPLAAGLKALAAVKDGKGLARWLAEQQLLTQGSELLFGLGPEQDFQDTTRVIVHVDAGELGLPDRADYLDEDEKSVALRARYQEHIRRLLTLVGDSPKQAGRTADEVLRLETELARATLTRVELRDPDNRFHAMSLAELRKLAPGLDWDTYFARVGVTALGRMDVSQPRFLERMSQLLQKEPLDVIQRYLRWHLVSSQAYLLSQAFTNEEFDFHQKYVRGAQQSSPRWKRCVRRVSGDLSEDVGQLFVQKTFSPELKASAQRLVDALRAEMKKNLQGLEWMSAPTRAEALAKLEAMRSKMGYPDRFRDYAPVGISRKEYFANVAHAVRFENTRQLAKIGKPVDRAEWEGKAQGLTGSYNDTQNAMEFGAGILQPPLFDPRMDLAPNYGDTGGMMGHELIHGFDDNGRKFDAHGLLRDWWAKEDAAEFERRASCISDQYSRYVAVEDVHVNGKLTLGEDVADLGGLILAYRGWKTVTAGTQLAPKDGLTPDQRFFVGYAQWACANVRPETARNWARTDEHSPNVYRVNGVVVNMPEFGAAFRCKAGQPMVKPPEQVCRVW